MSLTWMRERGGESNSRKEPLMARSQITVLGSRAAAPGAGFSGQTLNIEYIPGGGALT